MCIWRCGKLICRGCTHAFQSRAASAGRLKEEDKCPFCRTPPADSQEDLVKQYEKRIELNDANAIYNYGCFQQTEKRGFLNKIMLRLSNYSIGQQNSDIPVHHLNRDDKKAIHYLELAAMGGHVESRFYLGVYEGLEDGNMDRALKHYMIAVGGGYLNSLKNIHQLYTYGHATKDDYAKALRSYQAYLNEIKSDQRDEAAAFSEKNKYY